MKKSILKRNIATKADSWIESGKGGNLMGQDQENTADLPTKFLNSRRRLFVPPNTHQLTLMDTNLCSKSSLSVRTKPSFSLFGVDVKAPIFITNNNLRQKRFTFLTSWAMTNPIFELWPWIYHNLSYWRIFEAFFETIKRLYHHTRYKTEDIKKQIRKIELTSTSKFNSV